MCSSGVGFDPEIDGTHYTYDVFGLYNGLFVMDDRQTGSVWTHYDGTVLTGELAGSGARLEIQPMVHTTWADWLALYPDTGVLDWYPEFSARYRTIEPGRAGLGQQFQQTILNWDTRLPENELVLGVNVGTAFRAYVLGDFHPGVTAVNDLLGGRPIVVFLQADNDYGLAFYADLDGQVLAFRAEEGVILDDGGSTWGLDGKALSGPLAGRQLVFATSFVTEWYGWAAYHPDTEIFAR